MYASVERALTLLQRSLGGLEAEQIRAADAPRLIATLSKIEHLVTGARTILASRAADAAPHEQEGLRSPAEWLARTTGTTVGRAIRALKTSEQIKQLPQTKDALRSGRLSETQAALVADAAQANPDKEERLLEVARTNSLKALEQEAAQVRAAAIRDDTAWRRRLHERRQLSTWRDADGSIRLDARLAPDSGGTVLAAINTIRKNLLAWARRTGEPLTREQAAADALVELARAHPGHPTSRSTPAVTRLTAPNNTPSPNPRPEPDSHQPDSHQPDSHQPDSHQPDSPEPLCLEGGDPEAGPAAPSGAPPRPAPANSKPRPRTSPRATVHLRVDLTALQRGTTHDGETCEIQGFGPIPVAAVRDLIGDSILRIILADRTGDTVHATRASRTIPAHVRAAVEDRDQGRCVIPGCGLTWGLQLHHWKIYWGNGGPSELWNLATCCWLHHHLIHNDGFQLTGGPLGLTTPRGPSFPQNAHLIWPHPSPG